MKKLFEFGTAICLLALFTPVFISAQTGGLGINDAGAPAHSSAMLDVSSNDKGLLVPRMSTAEKNAIQGPAEGLLIFNTDNKCFEVYKFGGWYEMCGNCNPPAPVSVSISQTPANPVCVGNNVVYNVSSQINAGTAPVFSWYLNGLLTGITGTSFTHNNPSNGDNVVCVLASNAFCATNNPAASNSLTLSLLSSPAAPVATAATAIASSQFTANWNVVAGAVNYYIDVATDLGFVNFVGGFNNLSVGNITSYNVTGLSPQTDYYYRVRADNSCGTSNISNTISLSTPAFIAGKRVFLTSTSHLASLGGVSGADNICQLRANAAGLGGYYMAWLSSSSSTPSGRFTHSANPYVLINGTKIADNWADLIDGTLLHPIDVDEFGNTITNGMTVWTNTNTSGGFDTGFWGGCTSNICSNWTDGTSCSSSGGAAMGGSAVHTNAGWTHESCGCCLNSWRLYCFEQ